MCWLCVGTSNMPFRSAELQPASDLLQLLTATAPSSPRRTLYILHILYIYIKPSKGQAEAEGTDGGELQITSLIIAIRYIHLAGQDWQLMTLASKP